MASPFPFTAGQVLTAAELNAIGEVVAFTPSWTNLTPGNATEEWWYVRVNGLVVVSGRSTLGSTSSVTGAVQLDYPTGSTGVKDTTALSGITRASNSGTVYVGSVALFASNLQLTLHNTSGTYATQQNLSNTVPGAWSSGDFIACTLAYLTT